LAGIGIGGLEIRGDAVRFRVQMIGFLPGGMYVDVAWLTNPPTMRRVPIAPDAFAEHRDALLAALRSGTVYRLVLDSPDASPLPAVLRAIRDGGQPH
jgi:hypothetical protein